MTVCVACASLPLVLPPSPNLSLPPFLPRSLLPSPLSASLASCLFPLSAALSPRPFSPPVHSLPPFLPFSLALPPSLDPSLHAHTAGGGMCEGAQRMQHMRGSARASCPKWHLRPRSRGAERTEATSQCHIFVPRVCFAREINVLLRLLRLGRFVLVLTRQGALFGGKQRRL